MTVRSKLVVTLAAITLLALPHTAPAQSYPAKPIRLILPFPPGGPTDIAGRAIAQKLSEQIRQPVIPDNRPGAASNLGLELAAKSPPDGYTIVLSAPTIAISPALYAKLNYDAQKDLAPVSLVVAIQNVMAVHNSVPAKNLKEFAALARRNPGKLNFSSSGVGSTNHLASELFKGIFNLKMVHVPYKGNAAALLALTSGEVDFGTFAVPPAIPMINANRVRPLAVLSEKRIPTLPNVPTSKEAGVDNFVMPIWYGILAPAGTPRPIIDRLNSELHKALASPDLIERLAGAGVEPLTNTPEQFSDFLRSEIARFAGVVKKAGLTPE
ncbi:MAG TPA: tripartite tricarboxylate transporter substrate binding protein [Burkholderiales bacterium]|nr:tripartite tricarboxylate transporter substrate binding protein [Burkholderiales bacterium]